MGGGCGSLRPQLRLLRPELCLALLSLLATRFLCGQTLLLLGLQLLLRLGPLPLLGLQTRELLRTLALLRRLRLLLLLLSA